MKKIKYFKTESNSKKNKIYKDEMNQFNYRLFQINQENKKIKLNKLFLDEKELGLNQRIKSTKKENNIRTSNFIDVNKRKNNYILTTMYTNNSNISLFNNKINNNNNKNQINNHNMCLVPLFYHKKKLNQKELSIKLSNEKFYINKKNYKNRYNELLDGKNIFENRKRKELEENDMKPKIRFINLKKELIDENLKINKMHGIFQKQILEAEKFLKNKLSHLY